ncbi:pilus assembly protein TadG-related protein [Bacillus sp. 31A1R]|uniref:Pilus assembly protein TadG-related protein n=1 Tax=Robertmurraya mangrovi TaxID=3098077 RepID=A0ABU5J4U2_9BACI|nr:pilus assembly protein TadG-related protein [Bacillus sp. 31A1R]MDZ5474423.1 pilus assembly protein TadG-related protein [Bacillus sp. 31A1R]
METRSISNYIKNERGSGTVIIMIGLVLAAIFLALMFFDLSNVFINKRVTQTGADAAALAAAQTANKHMREDLKTETQKKLDELGERWEEFLEDALEAISEGSGEDGDEEDSEDPPTTEEILEEFVEMVEAELGKPMPGDIKAWLLDHSVKVKAETAMKFFFEDNEVSDMACSSVINHWDKAKQKAESYAKKNQNDELTQIRFIPEDFRVFVETERKGKYTTVSDDDVPAVTSESSVKIGEPKGYEDKISCD